MNNNWDSLSKRIAGAAKQVLRNNASSGLAIVNIVLLVDSTGNVLLWTEPKTTRVEPSREAVVTLVNLMGSEGILGED